MAYKADINIAVKGTRELDLLSKRLEASATQIDKVQKKLVKWADVTKGSVVPSLLNLNNALSEATYNFNKSVLGTNAAINAARNLVTAERAVNKELAERTRLLNSIRGVNPSQYSQPAGPKLLAGQTSSIAKDGTGTLVGQRMSSIGGVAVEDRIKTILSEQETLQQSLLGLERKATSELEKKAALRAKNKQEFRSEVEALIRGRNAEKAAIKAEVEATKSIVAEEIKRKQAGKLTGLQRRKNMEMANREVLLEMKLTKLAQRRARGKQFRGAVGSGLIGGAFPLLFGQGPGAAAGGALGGLGGGMMGGQFGFALSLVGTNIGAAVDALVTGAANLGKALNPLTADIGLLTQAVGIAGTAEGARLKAIEALSGKQAALAEATRLLNQKIGVASTEALRAFGENMRGVGNEFSVLMTKIGVAVATVVNDSGFIQFTNNFIDFANSLDQEKLNRITKFFAELTKNLTGFGPLGKVTGIFGGITGALGIKGKEDEKDQTMKMDGVGDRTGMLADQFLGKEKDKRIDELAILEKTINGSKELGNIEKMRVDLKNKLKALNIDINNVDKDSLDAALKGLSAQDKQIDAYKRQLALAKQIKSVLAEGMSSAIEGLITGTKSLSESLSQMLQQFGSLLLRTGISNMMGGLNLGGFFGKGIGSAEGNYLANGIRPFASGGMVTRPTMGLVGEAGEDEYVIPASKMAQSMQRYSAGARGQSVIPGTGASSSGGASGSSTTVNYSGPILNFNSEEFVPKSAVGQIIATATSQGAKAGESKTLRTLQNSRSSRTRIGL